MQNTSSNLSFNLHMDIKETQYSSSSPSSSSSLEIVTSSSHYKKRAAGRKKFNETRHPVYRGVRRRNRDKWVCEVREPNKKSRIWLGTFPNPEMAAVAHDVAALALRGDNAPLNFPDFAHHLPRPASSSSQDIQRAALQAARDFNPLFDSRTQTHTPSLSSSSNIDSFDQKMNIEIPSLIEGDDGGNGSSSNGGGEFVDEEAIFNMPVLLDSMAEGMLLTPPGMKKGFNWNNEEDEHDIDLTLWGD